MPMNNVDACVREADRAIDELGAKGIQIFTNVLGKPLSAAGIPTYLPEHGASRPAGVDHPIRGPQFADYATEKAFRERDLVHLRLAL